MEPETILVSACLVGVACNHRGEGRRVPAVSALGDGARLIPVCPEVAGGLPTPRPSAEIGGDGRVRTASGEDVSEFYERGARHVVAIAAASGARRAVLKARSPSCGCDGVYDGTHKRVLVDGEGITARALREAGVSIVSDEDVARSRPAGRAGE